MPELFIPLSAALGVALVFGIASLPPSGNYGHSEREQTHTEKQMSRISMVGWLAAFISAGCLIASYVAPAKF